jgi:RNA polymerase sigma-70 factor (ECF subfamily)
MPQINWPSALAEHDRWLRTVIRSRVGQASAVDDVMQEVALAAVRQQSPLADATKLGPWLYRLALTQSLLYRRKQGRIRKLATRYTERLPPSDFDSSSPDPLQWLLAEESQDLVRNAVARLSRRDVEILLLKYTEGWSYAQLAQRLGTTESAVESRLHRARTRLRRQLAALEEVRGER